MTKQASATAHLRVRRGCLETPISRFIHPTTGRRVTVAAMVHTGEARYYAEVKNVIAELELASAVVHHEGSDLYEVLADPPPDLTAMEQEALDAIHRGQELQAAADTTAGWVYQRDGFGGEPERWLRRDLGIVETIRLVGAEVYRDTTLAQFAQAEAMSNDEQAARRFHMSRALAYRLTAWGLPAPVKPTDAVVIGRRNEVALAGVDETDQDLVLVWGTAHLPGLAQGLEARGFVSDGQTWHRVGRLPGLAPLFLRAVPGALRSLRYLPAAWRAAADQVRQADRRDPAQPAPDNALQDQ